MALKFTSKMSDQKRIWRVMVPVVLLLLLLGATLGAVWHHHTNSVSDTCSLCHLVIAPAVVGIRACLLIPMGARPIPQYINFITQAATLRIPARAPPA
jgi:cation transporter-like permease